MNKKRLGVLAIVFVLAYIIIQVVARICSFSTVNSLYSAISLLILIGIVDLALLTLANGIRKKLLGVAILLYYLLGISTISSIIYFYVTITK